MASRREAKEGRKRGAADEGKWREVEQGKEEGEG